MSSAVELQVYALKCQGVKPIWSWCPVLHVSVLSVRRFERIEPLAAVFHLLATTAEKKVMGSFKAKKVRKEKSVKAAKRMDQNFPLMLQAASMHVNVVCSRGYVAFLLFIR